MFTSRFFFRLYFVTQGLLLNYLNCKLIISKYVCFYFHSIECGMHISIYSINSSIISFLNANSMFDRLILIFAAVATLSISRLRARERYNFDCVCSLHHIFIFILYYSLHVFLTASQSNIVYYPYHCLMLLQWARKYRL